MSVKKTIEKITGLKLVGKSSLGIDPYCDIQQIFGKENIKTVFDVGANEGQTVKKLLNAFPLAEIYSFEPGKEAYNKLHAKYKNEIKAFNIGLGKKNEFLSLMKHQASVTDSFLADNTSVNLSITKNMELIGEEKVKVKRLDEFCDENYLGHIDLLKIDTQGFELNVLKGAGNMLATSKIKAILLEVCFADLYEGQASIGELENYMKNRAYGIVDFYDKGRVNGRTIKWCDILFISKEL